MTTTEEKKHVLYNTSDETFNCCRLGLNITVVPGKNLITETEKNTFSTFIAKNKKLVLNPENLDGIAVASKDTPKKVELDDSSSKAEKSQQESKEVAPVKGSKSDEETKKK